MQKIVNADQFDVILVDLPFGILEDEINWNDTRFTSEQLNRLVANINAVNTARHTTLMVKMNPDQHAELKAILLNNGWSDVCWGVWIKPDATNSGGSRMVSACEHILFAYKGGRGAASWYCSTNPIKRQNVFKYPLVRNKITDIATGRPVNSCQAPIGLSRHLIKLHTPPGGNVLALCDGVGWGLMGGFEHGANVVSIEVSSKQTEVAFQRLCSAIQERSDPAFIREKKKKEKRKKNMNKRRRLLCQLNDDPETVVIEVRSDDSDYANDDEEPPKKKAKKEVESGDPTAMVDEKVPAATEAEGLKCD